MSELLTILHDTRRYARTVIVYKRPVKSVENFNRHSTRITSYLKQRHLVKKNKFCKQFFCYLNTSKENV